MKISRFTTALAVLSAFSLVACMSAEQRAITTYFEQAQDIAERLVEAGSKFETLMNVQENPIVWTEAEKTELAGIADTFEDLKSEAEDMSVPPKLADVHPLLVESLGEMVAAVEIIRGISEDPSKATEAAGDEMTAKATNAERLAGEYVTQLQEILEREYPEMME